MSKNESRNSGWVAEIVAHASAITPLSERDRTILWRSFQGATYAEIAADYGLSASRISEIVNRAYRATSHALRCIRKGKKSPDWQLMHMSNRLRVRLASNWDLNLAELSTITRADVLQWRQVGPVVVAELERLMESRGIKFREDGECM